MPLLDDLPRGKEDTRELWDLGYRTPLASFADPEQVAASEKLSYNPNGGIFLGTVGDRFIGTPLDEDRHILTVAGSRAGKSVSCIFPNLIEYRGSILVIDPKAELANDTARRRAEDLGQEVCVLDPFEKVRGKAKDYRKSFNPMSILLDPDNKTFVEDAGLIADALVIPSGGDTHWDDTARNFIEGVILHVATHPSYEGRRHLVTVRELLMEGVTVSYPSHDEEGKAVEKKAHGLDGLYRQMISNKDAFGVIEAAADDMQQKPKTEQGSVLSTVRRHTKVLELPSLRSVLSAHDFELTDLKTAPNGATIYLCVPASRLGMCNRWFRLFVNLALEAMERVEEKPKIPVLFLLDEFPILGHMRQLEDAAGQIAGFGVKLWPVLQDLGQLKSLYRDRWQTFMGNAGVVQFFGNSDLTTLEFVSKRLGKTSVKVERESDVTYKGRRDADTGKSFGIELHDLLTPEEIARFFGREDRKQRQLIIRPGKDPMVLERITHHEHPAFRDKYDTPD